MGKPYSAKLSANGGNYPFIWRLAAGSKLPKGLSLYTTGRISGKPKASGTTTFTVEVLDTKTGETGIQHTATATFTLVIS